MANQAIHTKLRNNPSIEYDQTTAGKTFEPDSPEWHTSERVNTYLVDCLMNYEMNNANDDRLWALFQEDFENWDENLFTLGHKTVRTALRDFMRDNGINIGGARYISQQLANILREDKYKEWPEEEIARQLRSGRTFNSYQNLAVRARIEASMAAIASTTMRTTTTTPVPIITPQRFTPGPTQVEPTPPPLPEHGLTTKALTDLSKLNNDRDKNQNGRQDSCQGRGRDNGREDGYNGSQNDSHDGSRDDGRDRGRDRGHDSSRHDSHNGSRNDSHNSSQGGSRDEGHDSNWDDGRDRDGSHGNGRDGSRNGRRDGDHGSGRDNGRDSGRNSGQGSGHDKRCFVYGRTGCWSTKHMAKKHMLPRSVNWRPRLIHQWFFGTINQITLRGQG